MASFIANMIAMVGDKPSSTEQSDLHNLLLVFGVPCLQLMAHFLKEHYSKKVPSWIIAGIIGLFAIIIAFVLVQQKISLILPGFIYIMVVLGLLVKSKLSGRIKFIFADWGCFVLSRRRWGVFRPYFPKQEKINATLAKYKFSDGGAFVELLSQYDSIWDAWKKTGTKKRPVVFFKVRIKKTLPWVDAVELNLLRDLKYIGLDIVIFVYDVPVNCDTGEKIPDNERSETRQKLLQNIRKIVGYGVTIHFSSQFFSPEKHSQELHDSLFGPYLKAFIEADNISTCPNPTCHTDQKELRYRALGYLSKVAVDIHTVFYRDLIWIIQWEKRATKWQNSAYPGVTYNLIITHTIMTQGKPINKQTCIHITDSETTTKSKLKYNASLSTDQVSALKDELNEFCALFKGSEHFEETWVSTIASCDSTDSIKAKVKDLLDMEFITGKKKDDLDMMLDTTNDLSLTQKIIQSDLILQLAYLKLRTYRILKKFKEVHGI